jgi:shikimate kinase
VSDAIVDDGANGAGADGAAVVLIGAPGAGKTRTGKRLARLLRLPFIDTDRRIVERHGIIAEIFAEHGEPHFRSLEREVVAEALVERAVVTLGGGAVLDPRTQAELARYPVVQLTVSAAAVEARLSGGKRPLLAGGIDAWRTIVEARQPLYDRLSGVTIDTSGQPLDRVAQQIAHWLERQQS